MQVGNVHVLQSVLGYEIDEINRMWLLDQGKIAYAPSPEGSQKLIVWDLNTNRMIDSIIIPNEIAPYRTSFLNDLVVDNKNGFVYITDSGSGWPDHPLDGGIIVYNMRTRTLRRVLDRHDSTQDFLIFIFKLIISRYSRINLFESGPTASPYPRIVPRCITVRSQDAIYMQLDTMLLRNFHTPLEEIRKAVRAFGSKRTTTDGMHADNQGNVFYTMLEGKGIGIYTSSTLHSHNVVSDDRMVWVDGVAFDQKDSIIFNSNRLHEMFGLLRLIGLILSISSFGKHSSAMGKVGVFVC